MSPGRIAAILFLLSIVTASAQTTPLTCGQPNTQGTLACFSGAVNLQSTDIIYGMQATGPQRSPQTVRITPAQIVAAGGGGGGGGSTLTFGTHLTGTSYNGSAPITLGTDATSLNNPSTIVARDSSGNFSIGSISGSLLGHASLDLLLTGGTLTGSLILNADPTIALGAATKNYVDTHGGGGTPANPTATAGPAAVNGSATTYMRSDAAPAIQKGTNSQFGIVEGDGATITCVAGVCTSVGGSATTIVPGTTTVGGASAPCVITNPSTTVMGCNQITGTGNVVFSTSPTLLTPALGTPSALVGTNITGTAAGLTAGTATAANGLNSLTTTVVVSAATAPTNGQVLTALSGGSATWQTPTAGAATSITPGTTTVVGATAPCVIENTATTVMGCTAETGTGSFVRATSPTLVTPALGTPASGVATNLTGTAASLTAGTATVANGLKSATTTVSVSAATAPTSGQVLTATGGSAATWQTPGSGTVSITSLTPNIVVAPSPITGTGTVSSVVPLNTQSGASYAILTGDNTQLVEMTNASATAMTIPVANSAGFVSGWGTSVMPTLAATTITPASGTIGGQATLTLQPGQFASIAAGSGPNYDVALGIPPSIPSGTIASGKNVGLDSSNRLVVATVGSGAASITPGTTTVVGATAPCVIENTATTVMGCTAETGTGSFVRATSPTLVTPALGTPASGTLTNATGLPIATGVSGLGTNVATALAATLSAAGGLTSTIASGTSAMGTSAISSGSCATVVTTSATGVATTDVVNWGFNGDPTGITGFTPVTTGMLTVIAFPSANNVNFKECNVTTASITPGAHTFNWRVAR